MRVVEFVYPTGARCVMHPDEAGDIIGTEIDEVCSSFYEGDDTDYSFRIYDMDETEFENLPEFSGP